MCMHHMKSHEAIDEVMWCVWCAWSRHYGPIQLVWCTQVPVLISHIELMHGSKGPDSAAGKHCVMCMHHMKSLEAIDEVMWCVWCARSRHYGPIQLVWWTQVPIPTHIFSSNWFLLRSVWDLLSHYIFFFYVTMCICIVNGTLYFLFNHFTSCVSREVRGGQYSNIPISIKVGSWNGPRILLLAFRSAYNRLVRCVWEHRDTQLHQYFPEFFLAFESGPGGPELDEQHKGIQERQVCASSNPKEKTPIATLRAAKSGRKANAKRPFHPFSW